MLASPSCVVEFIEIRARIAEGPFDDALGETFPFLLVGFSFLIIAPFEVLQRSQLFFQGRIRFVRGRFGGIGGGCDFQLSSSTR